jgi:hypothetical protein
MLAACLPDKIARLGPSMPARVDARHEAPPQQHCRVLAGLIDSRGQDRLRRRDVVPRANVRDGFDVEHFGEFAWFDADRESSTHSRTLSNFQ